jgi:DNA-binding NarL/FixJ family response regulator
MAVSVAVVDPLPLFRRGVATVLAEIGHEVAMPDDVLAWTRGKPSCLVLLTLRAKQDWELLAGLVRQEHLVVALIDGAGAEGARALRAGARSVLVRTAMESSLQRTVAATLEGDAVMPAWVFAALIAADGSTGRPKLSVEQAAWLRRLASGSTVAQLASEVGYSERTMFRLLHALYGRMEVRSRVEAVLRAKEQGWLDG